MKRARRSETDQFRSALRNLRAENQWSQYVLASKLGVSVRTLSYWENGYWLPTFRQRVDVVIALHDMPPEHVLEVADGLGVSVNPALQPLLQPYRDALDPKPIELAPPPPPPPELPRPEPSPDLLRAAVDAVVRDAADTMNVPANDLRAAIGRALAACDELGATMTGARDAVAVRARAKRGTESDA